MVCACLGEDARRPEPSRIPSGGVADWTAARSTRHSRGDVPSGRARRKCRPARDRRDTGQEPARQEIVPGGRRRLGQRPRYRASDWVHRSTAVLNGNPPPSCARRRSARASAWPAATRFTIGSWSGSSSPSTWSRARDGEFGCRVPWLRELATSPPQVGSRSLMGSQNMRNRWTI